jgi:phytoene desaturase
MEYIIKEKKKLRFDIMIGKKVIVIGAGFGGLAAAGLLAKDGFNVEVFEKNEQAGGRASVWRKDGFQFDMGPSWYLMPDVFEKFFSEFGKKPEDFMDLKRLDPSYKVFFDKYDIVDIYADLEKNLETFEKLEKGAKQKFKDYLATSKYQYDIAMKDFIYKDYKHLYDFFKPKLVVEGTKLHMFSKLDDYAKRFFVSEKIRKILEYTIVFLGGSPYKSPALYSLMSHVDFNMGVWYPIGGIGKLVEGMKKVAESEGAEFNFNQPVKKIKVEGGLVKGIETDNGFFDADIVICNADMPYAEMNLLDDKNLSYRGDYWDKLKMAPSAYLLFLGIDKKLDGIIHHNLYFDSSWEVHFSQIFDKPTWPDNPSYYVSATSKTDSTVAPKGCENLFVLVPVAAGLEDNDKIREKYYNKTLKHFEKLIGQDILDSVVVKRIFAHNDFIDRYHAYKGTALGLAHTLRQTAVFRPKHESKKVKNLYYTGHYNHPGIGVPMVIISSQIISNNIKSKQ